MTARHHYAGSSISVQKLIFPLHAGLSDFIAESRLLLAAQALAALRAGQSFALAAEEAGVLRATAFRWVKRDPYFAESKLRWLAHVDEEEPNGLLFPSSEAIKYKTRMIKK